MTTGERGEKGLSEKHGLKEAAFRNFIGQSRFKKDLLFGGFGEKGNDHEKGKLEIVTFPGPKAEGGWIGQAFQETPTGNRGSLGKVKLPKKGARRLRNPLVCGSTTRGKVVC